METEIKIIYEAANSMIKGLIIKIYKNNVISKTFVPRIN